MDNNVLNSSNPLQNGGANNTNNNVVNNNTVNTTNSNVTANSSSNTTATTVNSSTSSVKAINEKLKKVTFQYKIKDKNGKIVSSTFQAYNIEQVKMYLNSEGVEIISVKPAGIFSMSIGGKPRLSSGELSFALTQLSTYLKAGIPLIDSVRILAKQTVNKGKKSIYENVVFELLTGRNFSIALEKQGNVFPKLLINMVRTAEMTGDLPAILDDMAEYYTSIDATKRQVKSAMIYPTIVLVFAIFVLAFVLVWVVPRFVTLFADNNATLPTITRVIINISNFMSDNLLYIMLGIVVVLTVYLILFKNVRVFKKAMQSFYMRLPVIGKIIIYSEVTMFTKTFASLLNHGVFITDSMEVLSKVSDNEVYKDIVKQTIVNLNKGEKISKAFNNHWAFPMVAYEMIVTGENTGQLGVMMEKVSEFYQTMHKNMVNSLKSLIEPIMICFLAVAVGVIILSIIVPMFSLYESIQT